MTLEARRHRGIVTTPDELRAIADGVLPLDPKLEVMFIGTSAGTPVVSLQGKVGPSTCPTGEGQATAVT